LCVSICIKGKHVATSPRI